MAAWYWPGAHAVFRMPWQLRCVVLPEDSGGRVGEGERLVLVKTQEGAEGGPTGLPPEVASFVKETGTPVSDEGAWLPSAMTAWHGPSMQQSTSLSWRGAG